MAVFLPTRYPFEEVKMKRKAHIILLVLLLLCVLSTTAFAIDESEVESAIARKKLLAMFLSGFYAPLDSLKSARKLIVLWLLWESMLAEPVEVC